ncbi:short-chain dehydrogenase reductase sdr [Moniliophthora roreri]|uniref:Short-chain dehydrogenase reductase sdr n=1 Tax=Moniliophthora roreri TaxID=221103 RepID=A0A0W0FAR9_MONRR|nr:short-chain dehydrogenase reductase sdr [Moniliophthora roreri]
MSDSYTRVILVTGANTGIGLALVKLLAERGHTIYLGARNEAKGKEAQAALKKDHGLDVHFVQLDITDRTSIDKARDLIEQKEGHLDVLVNNAAVPNKEFLEPSKNDSTGYRHTFDTNFFGISQNTSAFVPLIRKAPIGHRAIVNVTSGLGSNAYAAAESRSFKMSGVEVWGYSVNSYSATKAALNSYTIALAHELIKEKIRVNAICPGLVSTNLNNHVKEGKTPEEGAGYILPWVLLGPEDDNKYCQYVSSGQPMPW